MLKFAILAIIVALCGSAQASFWTACGGTAVTHSVTSPACSGDRCHATRGQPLEAVTSLTFAEAHHTLDLVVTAYIFGLPIPLPLDPEHSTACHSLEFHDGTPAGCPTTPHQQKNWVMDITIPGNLPTFTNTRVKFELSDRGTLVQCIELTADLV